jgi:hypothetical protein
MMDIVASIWSKLLVASQILEWSSLLSGSLVNQWYVSKVFVFRFSMRADYLAVTEFLILQNDGEETLRPLPERSVLIQARVQVGLAFFVCAFLRRSVQSVTVGFGLCPLYDSLSIIGEKQLMIPNVKRCWRAYYSLSSPRD